MMVLPVAAAQQVTRSFRGTLGAAVAFGAGSVVVGLAVARVAEVAAPGGTIVLVAVVAFLGCVVVARLRPAAGAGGGGRMTRAMASDVDATAEARLLREGQRYTAGRRALVDALSRAATRSTSTSLTADVPQLLAYRNLAVLEQAGVVRRVITEGDFARFELAEDLTEHHHHLVCSSCGRVEDVRGAAVVRARHDRTLDRLARKARFATVSHRLDLIGTCRECAAGGAP